MSVHPSTYQHPQDKYLLGKMQSVIGFPLLVTAASAWYSEIKDRMQLLGDGVRVSDRHFSKINKMMPGICSMLGISCPEVYVRGGAEPDAFTSGIKNPRIVLSAGLLDRVEEDELQAIIAHECGHIACEHLLYHNVVTYMIVGASLFSTKIAAIAPLVTPFLFHWYRASEYSADRAAAVALRDAKPIQRGLSKLLTGCSKYADPLDMEEINRQADELKEYAGENLWKKTINATVQLFLTHPMTVFRIRELYRWEQSGELAKVLIDPDGPGEVTPDTTGNASEIKKNLGM